MWDRQTWAQIPVAILLGLITLAAVWTRRFHLARAAAVAEVVVMIGGWALAQYPYLIVPDLTYDNAAASDAMPRVNLIPYGIGAVILVPPRCYSSRYSRAGTRR